MNNFETIAHLKNFVNSLNEDELKQPIKAWGESLGGKITGATILNDDQINPSGEGCEDRSPYLPGGEFYEECSGYEDEIIVVHKGAVMFEFEKNGLTRFEQTFEHVFKLFSDFSLRTFLMSTPQSSLIKLRREADEAQAELDAGTINRPALLEEYADIMLCAISSAAMAGITAPELVSAMVSKIKKNMVRKWSYNGDGTYSHVKQ